MTRAENRGILLGFIAMLMFAFTLPATRFAVDYFHPVFIGAGRSAVAAVVAAAILIIRRQPLPNGRQLKYLLWTASGVVIAFPNLVSWAMETIPAGQGGVVLAFLPLGTALVASYIAKERPSVAFWLTGLLGCGLVISFLLVGTGGQFHVGDLALLGAVVMASIGYAVGGELSREMGGWQVICWAVIICFPLTLVAGLWSMGDALVVRSLPAWLCFIYLSLISQLIAFFFWYRALVIGGIARISQIMLLMPFVTIIAAMLFLKEPFDLITILFAFLVIITVAFNRMTKVTRRD